MTKTPIQWTDFSVNPFRFRNLKTGKVGHHCAKISPGCKNCYSSKMQAGPYLSGLTFIEENKAKGEFFLDEGVIKALLRRRKPARVFWCDMTDILLEDYPDEWIDLCFAAMALTPNLTHQVLTKRSKRLMKWASRPFLAGDVQVIANDLRDRYHIPQASALHGQYNLTPEEALEVSDVDVWPLPNVWLGVSVENQQYANERIPHLLGTPAALRFVSYEPALGPVDFTDLGGRAGFEELNALTGDWVKVWVKVLRPHEINKLDWIIIGGESGPGARPFDLAWARQTIEQCKDNGVRCFVKQLGARPFDGESLLMALRSQLNDPRLYLKFKDHKGGYIGEWPENVRVRQMPSSNTSVLC